MLGKLKKDNKGFTIIEVLIVLAIAGLIILIVFLAVPALQRNSRNTQRTTDVSRLASAVNECLNNNNGIVTNCDSFTAAQLNTYIVIGDNQQITSTAATPSVNAVVFAFGRKCDAAGVSDAPGGGGRAFTMVYQIETQTGTAGRCIGS